MTVRIFEHVQQHCCFGTTQDRGRFKKSLLFILFSVHKHLVTKVFTTRRCVVFVSCFFQYFVNASLIVCCCFFSSIAPRGDLWFCFSDKEMVSAQPRVTCFRFTYCSFSGTNFVPVFAGMNLACFTFFICFTYENKRFANALFPPSLWK